MRDFKKIVFFLSIAILFLTSHYLIYAQGDWQKRESDHFIIYYRKEVPLDYINQVAIKAEEYYQSIAANLGFNRYEFWLWDKRAKIYIFKDAQEYHQETTQPGWSGGATLVRRKIIQAYPWDEGFFDKLLPHELGHIMFHEFVGFKTNIPLWLDEGVAILQEESDITNYSMAMKKLRLSLPIKKLHNITTKTLIVPEIFYIQSASIVDYLLSQFNKDDFLKFSKALRNGRTIEQAIKSAYGFADLEELNKAWLLYLKELKQDDLSPAAPKR